MMDPASKLRYQGAAHDLSRAIVKFAAVHPQVRVRSKTHEDMMGQVLLHLNEAQKFLRHILEDIRAEGFDTTIDTVDPRD